MKILLYFSGNLFDGKGTPIRVRNILYALHKNNIEIYYAGREKPKEIDEGRFLRIGSVYSRPFSIIHFVKQNQIKSIYIQTSAGLWLAPFLKLFTSAAIGVDFHSLKVEEDKIYQDMGLFRYWCLKNIEKFLASFLDFATGVSAPLMRYYEKIIPSRHVLPGGVDVSLFHPNISPDSELINWKQDSVLIGYAGNLKWYQGVHTVLQAFAKLCEMRPGQFRLLIIASSTDDSVDTFIKERKLDTYVKILSAQKHEAIPALLASADILTIVRPSDMVTEYAFPTKFPEHAALGKALIVSRVGDVPHYIEAFKAGLVVEPENVDQLHSALLELADSRKREQFGARAWELVQKELNIDIIGKKLVAFLLHNDRRKR